MIWTNVAVGIPLIKEDETDWKLELEKHNDRLSAWQDEEATPSFSSAEFTKRMGQGEDWHKLVQANIYLEFVALKFLEQELTNPREIRLDRMSFSARLDLISALGLAPKSIISAVRLVSKKRNRVAHDLAFELSKQDTQQIASSISNEIKKTAIEAGYIKENEPIQLLEALTIIVLLFEGFRLARVRYLVWIKHKERRENLVRNMALQVLSEISS